MRFNNPIPRSGLPHFNEASPQRSPRDGDAVARQWLKDKDVNKQLHWLANSVCQLERNLERARLFKALSSDTVQFFVGSLFQVFPDYLQCYPYTEETDDTGTDHILVAKEYLHRTSSFYPGNTTNPDPRTVMDVNHTYTFVDSIDSNGINNVTRTDTSTDTPDGEDQRIIPPWVFADTVYAISCPTIIVDHDSTPQKTATWIVMPGSRQWAQI